jgi:phosphoribosylformylglycinamidine cyclo-ligase
MREQSSYKDAGVDIDKANLFISRIIPLIKMTSRKEVMKGIGGFGGLFHLDLKKSKILYWLLQQMVWVRRSRLPR